MATTLQLETDIFVEDNCYLDFVIVFTQDEQSKVLTTTHFCWGLTAIHHIINQHPDQFILAFHDGLVFPQDDWFQVSQGWFEPTEGRYTVAVAYMEPGEHLGYHPLTYSTVKECRQEIRRMARGLPPGRCFACILDLQGNKCPIIDEWINP